MKAEYIIAIQNAALADVMSENPPFDYFYRKVCRQYSEKFNTPLPQVYLLPFNEVLRDVTEARYEQILQSEDGEEDMLEMAQRAINPNYEAEEEQENEDFAKKALDEENLRKARQMAKEMGLNKAQPQPLKAEDKKGSPPQSPAGNSLSFDDEIPPEAFGSFDAGSDDF
jgi:hypothetical protein